MRYLGIDLGDKRTGLAVGDDETRLASPLKGLEIPLATQESQLLEAILKAVEENDIECLVIGLPLNMDDSEGPQVAKVRTFGKKLAELSNLPVEYQDERLTSFAADQQMARTGKTHKQKKQRRDALAAAEILRDYLNGT